MGESSEEYGIELRLYSMWRTLQKIQYMSHCSGLETAYISNVHVQHSLTSLRITLVRTKTCREHYITYRYGFAGHASGARLKRK